jgi:hypothetical protein
MKKFVFALLASVGLIGGAQAACVALGVVSNACSQSVAVSQGASGQQSQNATAIVGFSAQTNQATNAGAANNNSQALAIPGLSATNSTSTHVNQSTGTSANLSLGLAFGTAAQGSTGASGAGGNAAASSGINISVIALPTP